MTHLSPTATPSAPSIHHPSSSFPTIAGQPRPPQRRLTMSRGHGDRKPRKERRSRDDRHYDRLPQDHKSVHASGPPRAGPDAYSPPPEYTTDPEYHNAPRSRRSKRGHHASSPHHHGLNEDYYNPAPDEDIPRNSHRRGGHRDDYPDVTPRRSRRHARSPIKHDDESDYFSDRPKRRPKTESRGRRRERPHHRYDSDPSESDGYYVSEPERPVKPSRGKSFLQAIGIGKGKNDETDRERGRSLSRSPSRGRRGYRDYGESPSPPRRHKSAREPKSSGRARPGLSRTNTNWQRAANSAVRAGASAAYELRHDPSPWVGPKGIRVATAAIGAAVMDSMIEDEQPRRSGGTRSGDSRSSGGMRSKAIKGLGEAALRHMVAGKGRSRSRKRY